MKDINNYDRTDSGCEGGDLDLLDLHLYSFNSIDENREDIIFMQCTGLKDKNDKLIYEGDVVEAEDSFLWKVEWDLYNSCWYAKDINDNDRIIRANSFEYLIVIGNIYENPELLEGKIQKKLEE